MSTVALDVSGPLATITLDRPGKLNAVDADLAHDLVAAVDAVAAAPEVRVVLVRGAGRAFCAGLDRDMVARDELPADFFVLTERARLGLEAMAKITIALVHGYCVGGGVQLAIACDLRIAERSSRWAVPAVADALIPGLAPVRLPRLIGLGRARRLMLTGEEIDAGEAERIGLVDHVVPDGDRATVDAHVQTYLDAPRAAAAGVKALLARAFDPPIAEVAPTAAAHFAACLAAPDLATASERWRSRDTKETVR
jgi:enoyl-CoA hydratase/carnithine racemase